MNDEVRAFMPNIFFFFLNCSNKLNPIVSRVNSRSLAKSESIVCFPDNQMKRFPSPGSELI